MRTDLLKPEKLQTFNELREFSEFDLDISNASMEFAEGCENNLSNEKLEEILKKWYDNHITTNIIAIFLSTYFINSGKYFTKLSELKRP